MINRVHRLFQTLLWAAFYPVFRLAVPLKVTFGPGTESFLISPPVIIASNHKGLLDPFIIGFALCPPFSKTVHFMAKDAFFNNPAVGVFLRLMGAFPAYRGYGLEKSLERPKEILRNGGVIALFPEGKVFRDKGLGNAKRGVGALALETGAPVLPVAIRGSHGINLRSLLSGRVKIEVVVGNPECFRPLCADRDEEMIRVSKAVMEKIGELYYRPEEGEREKRIKEAC
ncbi:MAG: 1-acyl-sn-glycerol-3-phosphate acyltransferase [Deltaproteobacteria bacterium]|nr:1-acyl-sn-glycerol-3-phosphate acyltransferase [Deltaproteobacteria bacterium]